MEADPHGKLLWDVVALRLAAQGSTQATLTSRAKDLLGTATIASTITGVILNDKLFAVVKGEAPLWWALAAATALILIYIAGLWAILPRHYSFAPNAEDFYSVELDSATASEGELYRSMAEGYLLSLPGEDTQLTKNQKKLRRIERLVRIETVGIILLGFLAFWLAFAIHVAPVESPT